jgi:HK97 family phage major capsid protein
MTLTEMASTQVACLNQGQAIIDQSERENRALTQQELDQIDSLIAKANDMQQRQETLERFENQQAQLAGLNKRLNTVPRPRTLMGSGQSNGRYDAGALDPRSYAAMFGTPAPSRWQEGGREFYAVLQSERFDERLISISAAFSESSGAHGGYLVPEERAAILLDAALHQEIVRPRSDVTPMISRTKIIAGFDGRDQSSGLYGFTFTWLQENQSVVPGTGNTRAIQLTAHPGAIYLAASNELVQDAMDFEKSLEDRIIVAVAENMDYYYLNGTGANQPLGVLKSSARISVAKETGQAAATIETENVTKMFAASSNPTGAVWVVSATALPQLLALTISPTSSAPLVQQGADGSMTLLTRPLLVTSKLPVLGTEGDLLFADFAAYQIGLRKEVSLEKSRDIGFAANQTWYRAIVRTDGQAKVDRPFTGRDNQSYSPFVVLATRS